MIRNAAIGGLALIMLLLVTSAVLAEGGGQQRYFGAGPGYPDYSDKYYYRFYPPDQWGVYGYGTGHMGLGYGPYMYGKYRTIPAERDDYAMSYPPVYPTFKHAGNGSMLVSVPCAPNVRAITVNVLSFRGAILQTGTCTSPPFQIIAHIPEAAASIQVRIDLVDGFTAKGYSLVPGM